MFALPLFAVACFLMALKAQFQGVALVLMIGYVYDEFTMAVCIMLAIVSVVFGRLREAAQS